MKKIVKFEIPDESYVNDNDFEQFLRENIQNWYNLRSMAEIIILPSEEEMFQWSEEEHYDTFIKENPILHMYARGKFRDGVKKLLTKIKGE